MDDKIDKAVNHILLIKKWLVFIVMALMLIIVSASVVELAIVVFKEMTDPLTGTLFLEIHEFMRVFGFVFIVLIGFELLESITMYFKKGIIHAEVVILIAVIAISRKFILVDLEKYDPLSIAGLGFIMISLGVAYYLIKKSHMTSSN